MRLLQTTYLQFKEFFDSQVPRYAILSHRWDEVEVEVSFQEFEDSLKKQSAALDIVSQFCSIVQKQGFNWVWIDTCCIDKRSSAELAEAINSMYRWYERAEVCYAYLSDVRWTNDTLEDLDASLSEFAKSVWFRRGWTLQELLAPPDVVFLDCQWRRIGTKSTHSRLISDATGIGIIFLSGSLSRTMADSASIAKKMSWASMRETTRVEDMAYCLMGIFDVNMPLLYGEGRKAFYRLQLEIIGKSDDESIFAWTEDTHYISGLLAPWPTNFRLSAGVKPIARPEAEERRPYRMTNRGLEFQLPRSSRPGYEVEWNIYGGHKLILNLNCVFTKKGLIRISLKEERGVWYRNEGTNVDLTYSDAGYLNNLAKNKSETIYIYAWAKPDDKHLAR